MSSLDYIAFVQKLLAGPKPRPDISCMQHQKKAERQMAKHAVFFCLKWQIVKCIFSLPFLQEVQGEGGIHALSFPIVYSQQPVRSAKQRVCNWPSFAYLLVWSWIKLFASMPACYCCNLMSMKPDSHNETVRAAVFKDSHPVSPTRTCWLCRNRKPEWSFLTN